MESITKNKNTKRRRDLSSIVDKAILKDAIMRNEDVTPEDIMKKKERLLNNHIKNVYPIKEYIEGGVKYYYTKLNPTNRNRSGKISSTHLEDIEAKIVAYYLEIDLTQGYTVSEILELAIEELTPETATRHRQLFKKHFSNLTNRKISSLTEDDIRDCLSKMISDGIKSKAFNNATSTLNKINDYCVYHHIRTINIREKVSEYRKCKLVGKKVFAKDSHKETDLAFTENEAVSILKYAFAHPDSINLAIATLLVTGLRAGELLGLTPSDIDFKHGYINVDRMEQTRTQLIVDRCKDDSNRLVYLSPDSEMVLKKALEIYNASNTGTDFLFANPNSADYKLHLRALDNRLRKIQHELKFTDYSPERSPHDCRRTYASIQYLHGVDIKTIQAQLGHATEHQTWEYIKDIADISTRAEKLKKGCIFA